MLWLAVSFLWTSIVSRIKPVGNHEVPSYRWLQQGLLHLVDSLVFYHANFTLSSNERKRLSSTIHQLFNEGKLTKNPLRERLHIGAFLVRKLASAMLNDAIRHGTVNWDVTLGKTLSIVQYERGVKMVRQDSYIDFMPEVLQLSHTCGGEEHTSCNGVKRTFNR